MTRTRGVLTAIALIVAALLIAAVMYLNPRPELYRSMSSPNGQYRVVVYRYPQRLSVMPGQGSDAPGIVRLFDSSGRKLNETRVEMVSIADHVEWFPNDVIVPELLDWELKSKAQQ